MRSRTGQGGFTYFMLLWWVAISGVMLAALSQQWAFERRREQEAEMVARATEITHAIAAYGKASPAAEAGQSGPAVGAGPATLADLIEDRRGPVTLRHLRRIWADPLTGKPDWGLLRQGDQADAPIRGVYSRARGTPIRAPEGTRSYAEWLFEATESSLGP